MKSPKLYMKTPFKMPMIGTGTTVVARCRACIARRRRRRCRWYSRSGMLQSPKPAAVAT